MGTEFSGIMVTVSAGVNTYRRMESEIELDTGMRYIVLLFNN